MARLELKVRANARDTAFTGRLGETWKLNVAAPPVDGKANSAIVRFLADLTGIPSARVHMVTGLQSSRKIVEINGIDPARLDRVILESYGNRTHSGSVAPRKN